MKRTIAMTLLMSLAGATAAAAPMSVKDLLAVKWIKQAALSPDGSKVAFVARQASYDKNKLTGHIYLVSSSGKGMRRLTNSKAGESSPVFSPDGKTLAFVSARQTGKPQIWLLPLAGGEARRLTNLSTGAWGPVWSPNNKTIAFASKVYPACKGAAADACNAKKLAAKKKSKVKGRVITSLLYRHWNHWRDERRKHVFVVPVARSSRTMAPPAIFLNLPVLISLV